MWQLKEPDPVKLIVGILAADRNSLHEAVEAVTDKFGHTDMVSHVWPFSETDYYREETGSTILRQFLCFEKLIDPGRLAKIKHITNKLEKKLAKKISVPLSRPVNLDPGIIEPGKLILATTKNFSHRIYIGKNMYAEVTLIFTKGAWQAHEYTFPDYRTPHYQEFLGRVRVRLVEQLKSRRTGRR